MAILTKKILRTVTVGGIHNYPVKAATRIFEGAAVGIESATGFARGLVAGDVFVGFCIETSDNLTGLDAATRVNAKISDSVVVDVATATLTDVGVNVYAIDEDAFTLVVGANTLIGKTVQHIGGTQFVVDINI